MINVIKTLFNKTQEIETETEKLKSSNKVNTTSAVTCFRKNLLNYQVLSKKNIKIANLSTNENTSLYLNLLLSVYQSSAQNVELSLIVNNIAVYKTTKHLNTGYSEITLVSTYLPLDRSADIEIQIVPRSGKQVTVISAILSVWGLGEDENKYEYQAIQSADKFILSYIHNNTLYYSLLNQESTTICGNEFDYYSSAHSHAFAYDNINDITYLFRVDTSGNLFYSNFDDHNEIQIASGVKKVSAVFSNGIIYVAYIKDSLCYTLEISGQVVSTHLKINKNLGKINSCYIYYNKYNSKIYLILSNEDNNNFLLEQLKDSISFGENITANISLLISTYEVNNGV